MKGLKICFHCLYLFLFYVSTFLTTQSSSIKPKTWPLKLGIVARRGRMLALLWQLFVTNYLLNRMQRMKAGSQRTSAVCLWKASSAQGISTIQTSTKLTPSQEDSVLCWWQFPNINSRRASQPNWLANICQLKLTIKNLTFYVSSLNAKKKIQKSRASGLGKIIEYFHHFQTCYKQECIRKRSIYQS